MVTETRTRRIPYCVEKTVPYTFVRKVARCVPKTVEVKSTRMVCRQVPEVVEYEVCRMVPVTVCPQMGGCGTGTGKAHEALKAIPDAVPADAKDLPPMPEVEVEEEVPTADPGKPTAPASSA